MPQRASDEADVGTPAMTVQHATTTCTSLTDGFAGGGGGGGGRGGAGRGGGGGGRDGRFIFSFKEMQKANIFPAPSILPAATTGIALLGWGEDDRMRHRYGGALTVGACVGQDVNNGDCFPTSVARHNC